MRQVIIKELNKIEEQYKVNICYAVEAGSRAWGYPSRNSDYDVRFIYVHRPEWYLSIENGKEVIERPISDQLDFSGWDLRKALRLFKKSNPSIMEWLNSTIVYRESSSFVASMKEMQPKLFLAQTSLHHYTNMAKRNYQKSVKVQEGKVKSYLNILRPILAGKWILTYHSAPPICFLKLVEHIIENEKLKIEIQFLLDGKMEGFEAEYSYDLPVVSQFILSAISQLEECIKTFNISKREHDYTPELNRLFRLVLGETWF